MTPLGSNIKVGSCRFKIITQALYNITPQLRCGMKVIDIKVVELKDKFNPPMQYNLDQNMQ